MLQIYSEISVYIETENANKMLEKLENFSDLDETLCITGVTLFKGKKYSRKCN